jgi:hypothetical protein
VKEADLETVSKTYEKILSRHIYSVQKNPAISSTGQILLIDMLFFRVVLLLNDFELLNRIREVPVPFLRRKIL